MTKHAFRPGGYFEYLGKAWTNAICDNFNALIIFNPELDIKPGNYGAEPVGAR